MLHDLHYHELVWTGTSVGDFGFALLINSQKPQQNQSETNQQIKTTKKLEIHHAYNTINQRIR